MVLLCDFITRPIIDDPESSLGVMFRPAFSAELFYEFEKRLAVLTV